ncbi:hypothetical protein [Streptomyces sp. NPDC050856]|uniref:hypothetical protein n=1 Tax=Streptomyces sp. NPDC050856 TaxID=3154939 RepID=UPI00340C8F93
MKHVVFDACDLQRLRHAVDYAHHASRVPLGSLLPPWIPGDLKRAIISDFAVSHCATLLFPQSQEGALEYFRRKGWQASEPIPSVLVKRRLIERYGLPEEVRISVTRVRPAPACSSEVEIFLFAKDCPEYRREIGAEERTHGFENHVGLFTDRPDGTALGLLVDRLETLGHMVFEGSAHNPHENTTMFYFAPGAAVAGARRRFPRWELQCSGDLTAIARTRPVDARALDESYTAMKNSAGHRVLTVPG